METVEERVLKLKKLIEMSAVACGLNLTVYAPRRSYAHDWAEYKGYRLVNTD